MRKHAATETTLPLIDERVSIGKRRTETGRVRINTRIEEHEAVATGHLEREEVEIERVPINRAVKTAPKLRQVGNTIVIPILEEVLVVEKRLMLREELHVRKSRRREAFSKPVRLRRTRADIERATPQRSRAAKHSPVTGEKH